MSDKSPDTVEIKHVSLPCLAGNAHDDAEEAIRGQRDHDVAHGNELTWGLECTSFWIRGAGQ